MALHTNEEGIHYVEVSEIPKAIIKHFNHDIVSAKALALIRIFILRGQEKDQRTKAEMEAEQRHINKIYEWLDGFWEKHKQEFYAQGFKDEPYIAHPLFGAYNTLATRRAYLKNPKQENPCDLVDHILNGKQTTGPLSMDNIAESIQCSMGDTKAALSKLEALQIIGRSFNKNIPPYWYWINDETYLG